MTSGFILFRSGEQVNQVAVPVTLVIGCGYNGCQAPAPTDFAVTNGASFRVGASPGEAQTIFGTYLTTATASGYPLPTSLGNTQVRVNGVTAPLYYVSPKQINFQMPSGTTLGAAKVEITTGVGGSSSLSLDPFLTPVQPGLFIYQNRRAKALNQNLSVHTTLTPIAAGEYAVLFMTGMGATTPAVLDGRSAPSSPLAVLNGKVEATVGGIPADVQFAGLAPGYAGLVQVNVKVPAGLTPGDVPVFASVGGTPTNAGWIAVK